MQKKIVYLLVLMSCCVLGITGLQLYWNYQNYKTTVANFKKDTNHALELAVNKELISRHQELVNKVERWLADTSFITVSCDFKNRDSATVFTIADRHPRFKEDIGRAKKISMGISAFNQKLAKITPAAKKIFIHHFANFVFKPDLENGAIFYYTQGLGDSLTKAFDESRLSYGRLQRFYKSELLKKDIHSNFKINQHSKTKDKVYITAQVNGALRRPFEKDMVSATLDDPSLFYLKKMRWLIISSFLLIGITLFCFYYTIKTLFNQYMLVSIKNQFISNMTHEINTPLSSIQITAEALQQFDPDRETREKYLGIILYQTNKLNELSKEILANAKLETSTFAMDEEIELNRLVSSIIEDLSLDRNVNLSFLSNQDDIRIKGNRLHLTRSISNVLENAFKYNSSLTPVVEVKLTKGQKEVNLTIKDNGPGIADEFKQKIFEQFYRIPTGNLHNIKGYGLGLSYVKKVILQHHGAIKVLDNEPMGSVFSINLPN